MTANATQWTTDAIDLLYRLRLRYGSQMPLFFWKMIARAEHKLSQDLAAEHYEMEHDEDSTSPKTIEASR